MQLFFCIEPHREKVSFQDRKNFLAYENVVKHIHYDAISE